MRWNQAHIFTLKEAPTDAEVPSHKLLMRAGLLRKLAPGIYTYSHLLLRAIRNFESLVRQEMDRVGSTEILMPMVQPQALWEETQRWTEMGAGLLKFKNRNDQGFCLGATHEEAVTDYFRQDLKSYRDLPRILYQFQTKYRDEIRPRFGLMRGREFIMKDAYSFDVDKASALKTYEVMYKVYQNIFDRLGLQYRIVVADAGNIGGSQTHEFQLLAEVGEDGLLVSDTSDFAANVEVCPALDFEPEVSREEDLKPVEEFATPGLKTIEKLAGQLKVSAKDLVKTLFVKSKTATACVVLRGSDELNLVKLKNLLGWAETPEFLSEAEVKSLTGAWPGSCGPQNLKGTPVYVDHGLEKRKNWIVGANKDGFHVRNLNPGRDFDVTQWADLRMAREGDKDPKSQGRLRAVRGIEVGHVFYLGTKYSEKMNLKFLDPKGQSEYVEMGCYGIGITRTVQACLEQSHDADGIIWPRSITPVDVHICLLDPQDPSCSAVASTLERGLESKGLKVLVDDRDERPGVKFKDADLLGFPIRLVVGGKGLQQGQIEVFERSSKAKHVQAWKMDASTEEASKGHLESLFKFLQSLPTSGTRNL